MIKIEQEAWDVMVSHAKHTYPNECCGAMIGVIDGSDKTVSVAVQLDNAFEGAQAARYELRQQDLLRADSEARKRGLDLIGIFDSHPDCDAYFSKTDLENSCPWYSFVILSIKNGEFDHANSFLPDPDQTKADKEELIWPKFLIPTPLRQYAEKKDTVELSGATVGEVLSALTTQFGDLRKHLFNDEGKLRTFVNVYLNDEDIRYLDKEKTAVKDGDTLSIVPSIAGGGYGG